MCSSCNIPACSGSASSGLQDPTKTAVCINAASSQDDPRKVRHTHSSQLGALMQQAFFSNHSPTGTWVAGRIPTALWMDAAIPPETNHTPMRILFAACTPAHRSGQSPLFHSRKIPHNPTQLRFAALIPAHTPQRLILAAHKHQAPDGTASPQAGCSAQAAACLGATRPQSNRLHLFHVVKGRLRPGGL